MTDPGEDVTSTGPKHRVEVWDNDGRKVVDYERGGVWDGTVNATVNASFRHIASGAVAFGTSWTEYHDRPAEVELRYSHGGAVGLADFPFEVSAGWVGVHGVHVETAPMTITVYELARDWERL